MRAQNLYLSEGVHCVGIDRQPHKPRRLPQIKMGFGGFKSLFTLKESVPDASSQRDMFVRVFRHQPRSTLDFCDAHDLSTHPDVGSVGVHLLS